MTENTYKPMFPETEVDAYRRQRETLADLLAFVDEHAPNKPHPLPVLPWHVGSFRTVSAEVGQYGNDPSGARQDRPALIQAYAEALGVEVKTKRLTGKTRHYATGRIGRPEGSAQEPRTTLHISADVWDEDDRDDRNERAVIIGAGSPETSALTHCPTCGSPEWLPNGRRGWNPVDVECEVCAGTYNDEGED